MIELIERMIELSKECEESTALWVPDCGGKLRSRDRPRDTSRDSIIQIVGRDVTWYWSSVIIGRLFIA